MLPRTVQFDVAVLFTLTLTIISSDHSPQIGGLEVSVLAFGTRVRGFKPGRSRRALRAKNSSARLPSEGK